MSIEHFDDSVLAQVGISSATASAVRNGLAPGSAARAFSRAAAHAIQWNALLGGRAGDDDSNAMYRTFVDTSDGANSSVRVPPAAALKRDALLVSPRVVW